MKNRYLRSFLEKFEFFFNRISTKIFVCSTRAGKAAGRLKDSGDSCFNSGDLEGAISFYKMALEVDPFQSSVYNNLGVASFYLKKLDDSLVYYSHAIQLRPEFADAYNNRGLVLHELGLFDAALESYDRAIKLESRYFEAYYNKGNSLVKLKRFDEALKCYDFSISVRPDYFDAHNNRGALLCSMRRFDEALVSYHRAIELGPDNAIVYNNLGYALDSLRCFSEALECYDKAIDLKPDYGSAYNNRAVVLDSLNNLDEAMKSYHRALVLMPDYEFLFGQWLDAKMQLCDWSGYESLVLQLAEKIQRGEAASTPFLVLSKLESRILQKKSAEIYVEKKCPVDDSLPKISKYPRHKKIRVGYFSADFRNHPVSFLTAELFETHDRSKFEFFAFSFGSDVKDEMSHRVAAAFDNYFDVNNKSDKDIAVLARALEIDIAIDLGGFTTDSRTGIFALRAAPIQVGYLGYLGTMGADYIDYLIADATIVPLSHQVDYREKIIYLPSYQVNDTKRIVSNRIFSREELGLPDSGFVFCCFNNSYKITPDTFSCWMRILKKVDDSVLWLLGDNEILMANLRAEAVRRGVDAKRLVFAGRLPLPEYLARYRVADLFLDTLPYNAGTTASDALWVGLPVLTCQGETFAARVASSLLNAIGLPELITTTQEDYENMAIKLAIQPEELRGINNKLANNRLKTILFNTEKSCRSIESAYEHIYENCQAGNAVDHVFIECELK